MLRVQYFLPIYSPTVNGERTGVTFLERRGGKVIRVPRIVR